MSITNLVAGRTPVVLGCVEVEDSIPLWTWNLRRANLIQGGIKDAFRGSRSVPRTGSDRRLCARFHKSGTTRK